VTAITWVLGAAAAVLAPALAHGAYLGPYDVLSRYGLSAQPGVLVHYSGPSDQIQQMIPWTALAWTQVHHGQLPLWNPYAATGMPLAFNWLSAAFSVPSAVGYLLPLHLAYTAQIVLTLVIAGTGAYALGRVLGLAPIACAFAATVFELSGPLMGWLGWPLSGVISWAGWLFAATILVLRGPRARAVVALAVTVAFVVYAGQPETAVELAVALVTFVVAVLVQRTTWLGGSGPILRPALATVAGALGGLALSAPLLLPGLQVTSTSIRRTATYYAALPSHELVHVLFQGFDGLPVAGSRWFGYSIYPETAAYVGVIAVVLAATAVGLRRRPEVLAFAAVAVVTAAVVFVSPVVTVLHTVTHQRGIAWQRSLLPMAFALSVLAGAGADVVVRSYARRAVRVRVAEGFALAALVTLGLWLFGRGALPPTEAAIRRDSFLWPTVDTVVGLAVVGGLTIALRRRSAGRPSSRAGEDRANGSRATGGTWAVAVLLACETGFLVAAGAPVLSSSPTALRPTPAEAALQRMAGSSLVGLGGRACYRPPTLGILPNVNVAFGVHELAVYDPVLPSALFGSWRRATGEPAGPAGAPLVFCPAVTTVATAREYGIGFVLEPAGVAGPRGTVLVARVGGEGLWRVPDASAATLTALTPDGGLPGPDAGGTPVAVSHPSPSQWNVTTRTTRPQVLRLRLTDVPGWHATIDGRPLALTTYDGIMLQARVPAGTHRIALDYWPSAFTAGLALALAAVVVLIGGLVVPRLRRSRRSRRSRRAPRHLAPR
jgi:hypothetical protein